MTRKNSLQTVSSFLNHASFFLALGALMALTSACGNSSVAGKPSKVVADPYFAVVCNSEGGTIVYDAYQALCQTKHTILSSGVWNYTNSNFPLLNPYDATEAATALITVYPGDRIVFNGSGNWQPNCSTSYDSINLDGLYMSDLSPAPAYEGYGEGLMARVNGQNIFLGSTSKITVGQTGYVQFGFNATPYGTYCGKITVSDFYIAHCENSVGTTSSCPM